MLAFISSKIGPLVNLKIRTFIFFFLFIYWISFASAPYCLWRFLCQFLCPGNGARGGGCGQTCVCWPPLLTFTHPPVVHPCFPVGEHLLTGQKTDVNVIDTFAKSLLLLKTSCNLECLNSIVVSHLLSHSRQWMSSVSVHHMTVKLPACGCPPTHTHHYSVRRERFTSPLSV